VCACCNDPGICLWGTFCHSYLQASALAEAGEGSLILNFLISAFEYNGGIICLSLRVDSLNVRLGGEPNFTKRVCCHCCCARCAACQLARAVKKMRKLGLKPAGLADGVLSVHSGAPSRVGMER
jgi:hypothetical protein